PTDGARQRRAVPRVPMLELPGPGCERVIDPMGAEGRREWGRSRRRGLPAGEDVGFDWQLLAGEPAPGPGHAADHFVEADQEAVLLAPFGEALPETLGRRVTRQRRAADRLTEERCHRLRAGRVEHPVEL